MSPYGVLTRIPTRILNNIAVRLLCWDNYLSSFADRFLVGVKEVKILHREGWAGSGESRTICEFLKE